MTDYTSHQLKIIDRYYDQRDTIMLNKLGELVTELYLADSDTKKKRLWGRVEKAMTALKVPNRIVEHILNRRDPETLAANLKDWLAQATRSTGNTRSS